MAAQAFKEIENQFARLSPDAQLTLLERLVHRVRVSVSGSNGNWDAELSAMAADPEVRRELEILNSGVKGSS